MSGNVGVQYQFVKKILHIRTDKLGMVLMATPFLELLKQNFPDSTIHSLVLQHNKQILENCPFVNDVRVFDDKMGLLERYSYFKGLASEGYDMVIAHTPAATSYIGAFLTGATYRVGLITDEIPSAKLVAKFTLTDSVEVPIMAMAEQGNAIHEVDMSFKLAEVLGIDHRKKSLFLKPDAMDQQFVDKQFHKWGWGNPKKIFCIHLSDKWLNLGWDKVHFQQLVREILDTHKDSNVLFTYGSWSLDIGREIDEIYKKHPRVKCIWDMTIRQWAAMIGRCSYILCVDTAAAQVAASQKTGVIAIYPPDQFDYLSTRFAPWKGRLKKLRQAGPKLLQSQILKSITGLNQLY